MKKALCVGISYQDSDSLFVRKLPKAQDDAARVRDLLINTYEYDRVMLLQDNDDSDGRPTRDNILQAMENLVTDASEGDRLVFHYSGHGSQVPCQDQSEADGLDEVIWPEDVDVQEYTESNIIVDNDIHDILVEKLPTGAHMTIIFDCCHSGTAADLPEHTRTFKTRGIYKVKNPSSGAEPTVVAWSACQDPQEVHEFGSIGGLLVHLLCNDLNDNPDNLTYGTLLQKIQGVTNKVYQKMGEAASTPHSDISVLGDYDAALHDIVEL